MTLRLFSYPPEDIKLSNPIKPVESAKLVELVELVKLVKLMEQNSPNGSERRFLNMDPSTILSVINFGTLFSILCRGCLRFLIGL